MPEIPPVLRRAAPAPAGRALAAWRWLGRISGRLVLGALALGGLLLVVALGGNVRDDLAQLNSAQSENFEFMLAQVEVEFLEYARGVDAVAEDPAADLAELRRRFDIFHGRIDTVEATDPNGMIAGDPATAAAVARLRAHLDRAAPLIDGPDAALRAGAPSLRAAMPELRAAVRTVALGGLDQLAERSDDRREAFSETLIQMAVALAALLVALLLLAGYLARLGGRYASIARKIHVAGERMHTVMETSHDAVIVTDRAGVILEFNAAAERMFGHRAADVAGRSVGDLLVPPHLRPAHEAGMARMRDGGARGVARRGRITTEAMRADGRTFPVELSIQSAPTDEGEVCVAFLRDISDRVAAEAELIEARDRALAGERAKAEFLAVMSHEIRTPLNGLLGNLALLREGPLDDRQERLVRNMESSGELLLGHVSDVLDITRYEAGKPGKAVWPVHLGRLIQGLVDSQASLARSQETRLGWTWVGPPQDWLYIDRVRVENILQNLIGNAVKFTRGGHVAIEVRHDGETLGVAVADTGVGIPREAQSRIFEDFWTGDRLYDRATGGTGLGLGLVRRYVAALDGTIEVESAPGEGATFTLSLPAPPAPVPAAEAPAAAPDPAPRSDPRLVLVVEDNAINRQVAREMLAAGGHEVVEAVNGRDGVDRAAARAFDLILMDIAMPVMDGRAATRAIRAGGGASARVPIVALTANVMASERAAFLRDGMNDVLTKPLRRAVLDAVIARLTPAPASPQPPPPSEGPAVRAASASPPSAAPARDVLLLDPVHLEEMRELLGPDRTALLTGRFATEMEALLAWLGDHADDSSAPARLHSAAGSAATFGALALHAALAAAERAALAGEPVDRCALVATWSQSRTVLGA